MGWSVLRDRESRIPLAVLLILAVLGSTLVALPAPAFANTGGTAWCSHRITTSTTLSANIGPCSGDGLVIGASGITLNCAGHSISGEGYGSGITLTKMVGATVENCNATGFLYGFYLFASSSNTFTDNTAEKNTDYGFYLYASNTNTLTNNIANGNAHGFHLRDANSNLFDQNTVSASGDAGFYIQDSKGNTFYKNRSDKNLHEGFVISDSASNVIFENTAIGNHASGFLLQHPGSAFNAFTSNVADFDLDGFYLILGANRNTFTSNTANYNKVSVALFPEEMFYCQNICRGNGFYLYSSSDNTLTENTANSNAKDGFYLSVSSSNLIGRNLANSNTQYGYFATTLSTRTARTGNTYSLDKCVGNVIRGSSPTGLCTALS
jgi:parallel beta-helix repeat protein